jgi:hypothetical protein
LGRKSHFFGLKVMLFWAENHAFSGRKFLGWVSLCRYKDPFVTRILILANGSLRMFWGSSFFPISSYCSGSNVSCSIEINMTIQHVAMLSWGVFCMIIWFSKNHPDVLLSRNIILTGWGRPRVCWSADGAW